jgi:hypothetical protein
MSHLVGTSFTKVTFNAVLVEYVGAVLECVSVCTTFFLSIASPLAHFSAKGLGEHGTFSGTVTAFEDGLYHVRYSDGDQEDLDPKELQEARSSKSSSAAAKSSSAAAKSNSKHDAQCQSATKRPRFKGSYSEVDPDYTPQPVKKKVKVTPPAITSAAVKETVSQREASSPFPMLNAMMLMSAMGMGGFGGFGNFGRSRGVVRSRQLSDAKDKMEIAGAEWAKKDRPFQLSDLTSEDHGQRMAASEYYNKLKLDDLRAECKMLNLSYGGAKYKVLERLMEASLQRKMQASRMTSSHVESSASTVSSLSTDQVRRNIVRDLKKNFKYDKKLKRGGKMILKATCHGVSSATFTAMFPRGKVGKRLNITESDLGMGTLHKTLRYGGWLTIVDNSLGVKFDGDALTVTGKMHML